MRTATPPGTSSHALLLAWIRQEANHEDPDQLYDQVRSWLERVHQRLLKAPIPDPVDTAESLPNLEHRIEQLHALWQWFRTQLVTLEHEFDVTALTLRLQEIEATLQLYQSVVRVSERMIALRAEIDLLANDIYECLVLLQTEEGQQRLPAVESRLERVMDSYTSVTEQLQDYQSVYDIESLTAAHEDLNALISSLEEQIDSLATL